MRWPPGGEAPDPASAGAEPQAVNPIDVHPESWFVERIGKRIRRLNDNGCSCTTCAQVLREGLMVFDDTHADCLYSAQGELGSRYADWKE